MLLNVDFPMAVVNILKILKVEFKGVNVLENQNLREGIKLLVIGPLYRNYI